MQFSNFTSSIVKGYIIFKTEEPIEWVSSFLNYNYINKIGDFSKEEFRWSFNNSYWSTWTPLNISNLADVSIDNNQYIYLQFRFKPIGVDSTIENININFFTRTASDINDAKEEIAEDTCCSPDTVKNDEDINVKVNINNVSNADLLDNQHGDYYLWRQNHKGTQPINTIEGLSEALRLSYSGGLTFKNINDSSTAIGTYSFQDSSIVYFKSIQGDSSTISVYEKDSVITLQVNPDGLPSQLYDSVYDPNLYVPTAVGGIAAGTQVKDLEGKSYSQLFDEILFPTVNPVITSPSITLAVPETKLYEVGTNINVSLAATFNRGLITVPNFSNKFRAGLPSKYVFNINGSTNTLTTTELSANYYFYYIVLEGFQGSNWMASVNYTEGDQPVDSKGANYSYPLPAGIISTYYTQIEGTYPIYATSFNINTLTKQPLMSINSSYTEINLVNEIDNLNRQSFALPKYILNKKPLKAIQTFNSLSGQYQDTALSMWLTKDTSISVQSTNINYLLYSYNGSLRDAVKIKLIF